MNNKNNRIHISVIIPVYFNEGSLVLLTEKLKKVLYKYDKDVSYELIFIDDGSKDNSFSELLTLRESDRDHIKLIKFTRNFGQVPAIYAGYKYANGDAIINISADLQDPPELIFEMLNYFFNEKYDIVICTRENRKEPLYRKITSKIFYKLINWLSFSNMPTGGFDYVLISNKVKEKIIKTNESNPFWQGQILWTGFDIKFIPYTRRNREVGESKWTFAKKVKLLIDGIMSYSYLPIRLVTVIGMLFSVGSFVYALVILILKLYGGIPVQGWAPIMIIILFSFGVQMLTLGIIGEYIWRTLDQVRNREQYIIDDVFD